MTRNEIREAIQSLFAVFDAEVDAPTRECDLRLALDRIALASHFVDVEFDPNAPSPDDVPTTPYKEFSQRLGQCFPGLGYYSVSLDSTDLGEEKPGVGDAIDDLADIARDLQEVLLRWETSEVDALWHFQFNFGAHWGQHLRALQLHLHERAF
ncbi:DUF5063 domain-containing protein [Corallococcus terminator]|uniref:DUF5063 domain-containing protein n=1 Tax=Corallococcus terminator TaxID=2316733 RepID=A0A3A8IL50_9BACT|nr:DUF5063 domain-containing protein [Corallococcus terminator]RKG83935.1 DUF5063 domain-containing protein [Corallococcus terminator]